MSEKNPAVSVALPAFKAMYLKDAIKSILCQTFEDFELIIVNDASKEDLKSIVEQFKDRRIKYFENKVNLGKESVVKNWNKCLEYATGEYFVLFSDDDIYSPFFLEEMIRLAEKYPLTNLFHSRVRIITDTNETLDITPSCPEWESGINFIWHRIRYYRYQYAPDFFMRTEYLKKINGFVDFPLAWCSDDATWFILSLTGGVAYSEKLLCNWRRSPYNISKVGNYEKKLLAVTQYAYWILQLINKLKSENDLEDELIKLIKTDVTRYIYLMKVNILSDYINGKITRVIRTLFMWNTLRIKYGIKRNELLKAVISSLSRRKITN